jgi:hypothetical protein
MSITGGLVQLGDHVGTGEISVTAGSREQEELVAPQD